jgi:hypothetical protein
MTIENILERLEVLEDKANIHLRIPFDFPWLKNKERACNSVHGRKKEHKGEFDCPKCQKIFNEHEKEIVDAWHQYWNDPDNFAPSY